MSLIEWGREQPPGFVPRPVPRTARRVAHAPVRCRKPLSKRRVICAPCASALSVAYASQITHGTHCILPTQLRACERYCHRQGYEILERFHEEGESAKTTDRSQLQNLLMYCRLNKGHLHFVVVLNLTRFARDKYDHFALRSHLQSLGNLAAVGDGADRRHFYGQADGRRAGCIRSV